MVPGAVVLDTSPLSLVTQLPGRSAIVDAALAWIDRLAIAGIPIFVPEVADYELRRTASIRRLDAFNAAWPPRYLALTTTAMRHAAEM